MRAFTELWDEITLERYGVTDAKHRRVPLRRAGELARADRAAAGEQRLSHSARDAGRDAFEECARPRRAASRLERGAGAAASVGPAVVAADAADPRLRDRPAGVRRHLRWLDGDRAQGRGAEGAGQGRAATHRGDGRRRRGHRLHEAASGREQHGAAVRHRDGRADRRRRQQVDRDRAVAAVGRRRRHHGRRPGRGARAGRAPEGMAR